MIQNSSLHRETGVNSRFMPEAATSLLSASATHRQYTLARYYSALSHDTSSETDSACKNPLQIPSTFKFVSCLCDTSHAHISVKVGQDDALGK